MGRLVDHEALLLDLEAEVQERASWGRAQLLGLLAELRTRHRVSESDDEAVLRRFSGHLTDTFFGLVPMPPATDDPLAAPDPQGTSAAMGEGATSDHPLEGQTHERHAAARPG